MIKSNVDYSIYVITDPFVARIKIMSELASKAIEGGATCIQYRDKRGLSTRSKIEEAKAIQAVTKARGIPLIINDRLDIALAVGADGLHLGQDDLPIEIARKHLGDEAIIGVSVRNREDSQKAIEQGADYLAVSGLFPSTTKLDTGIPLGIEVLKDIAKNSPIPVLGIGGINTRNAGSVIQAGAKGIAVISSVVSSKDPAAAVRSLKLAIQSSRTNR